LDVSRSSPFFRGSELTRLVILAAIMVAGWALVWGYAVSRRGPEPAGDRVLAVEGTPRPVVADRSAEFETVTDRTPMGFRDNAAYAMLLERARNKSPVELATDARRDIFLTHLWERPELYRGVPIHLLGTARRVLYYESKLSRTGWIYEAWIFPVEERGFPYVCVFEEAPKGFPIGPDVSERVVFNGYFLKLLRYQAGDVPRGAPVLVGRLGWDPSPKISAQNPDRTLFWSLVVLGLVFTASLLRWGFQLLRYLGALSPRTSASASASLSPSEEIDPAKFQAWLETVPDQDEPGRDRDEGGD
jgi:hypothetical protein